MTEQPPSASQEARTLAERIRDRITGSRMWWHEEQILNAAREIDALCEQRVSAAVRKYQGVVASAQSLIDEAAVDIGDGTASAEEKNLHAALAVIRAPAERPAPPQQKEDLPRRIGVEQPAQDSEQPDKEEEFGKGSV